MRAIIIDDDPFFSDSFSGNLKDLDVDVDCFCSLKEFEACFTNNEPDFLIVDLAIPTDGTTLVSSVLEAKGGYNSGIAAIRKIKTKWSNSRIALITGGPSLDAKKWCEENNVVYLVKPIERSQLERFIGKRKLKAFVVHGRDKNALRKAKEILKEIDVVPIVLMEMPSRGRTVIEKFEEVAHQCDLAFVIMTPDDIGVLKGKPLTSFQLRCRQNVIFELGYFFGALGKGKVNIIEFGKTEIPSDLNGIIRLNGNKKKGVLKNDFKREIECL